MTPTLDFKGLSQLSIEVAVYLTTNKRKCDLWEINIKPYRDVFGSVASKYLLQNIFENTFTSFSFLFK